MPKAAAAATLAQLRALRTSGKSRLDSYQVADAESLYEEVDEERYKSVVRERLDRDDFVVDDNGKGYADDGREEWGAEPGYETASGSEGDRPLKGAAAKRKREQEKAEREKTNNSINNYFNHGPATVVAKAKPVATKDDTNFMSSLLGDIDGNVVPLPAPSRSIKSENRRKVRILSPTVDEKPKAKNFKRDPSPEMLPTPPFETVDGDDDFPMEDENFPMSDPAPSSPLVKAVERKTQSAIKFEEEEDDLMEISEVVGNENVKVSNVNISGSRPAPKLPTKASYPTPESSSPAGPPAAAAAVDATAWTDVNSKLNVLSSPVAQGSVLGKVDLEQVLESDGSLRMFWTDYTEVNGSLSLFGKVKNKTTGQHVSAFLKVDNVQRKLFFLPRASKNHQAKATSEAAETSDGDEDVFGGVYEEVDGLLSKIGVKSHRIKTSERKYAFELPGIPKEAKYLKVMYGYDKPALPMGTKGETFSDVFGTNTGLFEQFVLWKNIMGPCWLTIDAGEFTTLSNCSWCKLDVVSATPKAIAPLSEAEAMEPPPLTIMSLAFRTVMNVKENRQEILMASARVYDNVVLSDTTGAEKLPCRTFTVIRPFEKAFPIGFETAAKKQRGSVLTTVNEQMLLSKFMAELERADPDVLIGHSLQDVDYPVLLSRMQARKTPSWHRIGRLRRSDWPKNMGKGNGSFFAERQLVSGRLMCDLANDLGKSLMTKCQSWSLTEMCDLYLGSETNRQDVESEAALKTWAATKDGLLNFMAHCETDTHYIAAIALRVQMLPLSKVLTNLAGNSWARTLSGTRAERNEYILLHEFHRNKYICPDKIYGKSKPKADEENADGDEGVDTKKKDKYKGGLVLEPEKGLYDKFVLVMDFNSLYPSIIQEYDICFTTVERSAVNDDEEHMPDLPDCSERKKGILPKLIATLVNRRREVKKLMKDKTATPEQLATWDIKQLALKLTANSMYGCLGFRESRFYARALAMLTTFQGREILRSTKELAETNQLQVIYGDTDSVMINTNTETVEEAYKVGNDFKRAVNERYKLLEIDIDNVFRRLLLHAKKKYAAINLVQVDGKYVDKLEVKGLDMRRREYCAMSKEASSSVLNEILSGEDPEVVVTKIHEYLRNLLQRLNDEKIANHHFIMYNKLGKDPRSYPNADSMPQVQVALRALGQGKSVRANDVISYIITAPTDTNSGPPAKRAYSPQDVAASAGALKPDVEYYITKQLLPPLERLCAPIAGTSAGQLAECFGLDPARYSHTTGARTDASALDLTPLESQLPDALRFKDCPRLTLSCLCCKHAFPFLGLAGATTATTTDPCTTATDDNGPITTTGIVCPASTGGCGAPFRTLTLVAQVEHALRSLASTYYDAWLVCDDTSCGARTRALSVYGHRCLGPRGAASGCLGRMRWELPAGDVARTLAFWRGVWDVEERATAAVGGKPAEGWGERRRVLAAMNRERFAVLRAVVEAYEKRCGWVWVQMDGLFGFAMK